MTKHKIRLSDPVYYDITVAGELPQGVIEILANFFVGNFLCKYQNQITQIEGLVKDQPALSGLLSFLCDLHYVLLSVKLSKKQYALYP